MFVLTHLINKKLDRGLNVGGKKSGDVTNQVNIEIIDMLPVGHGTKRRDLLNFYWGVGVTCNEQVVLIDGTQYYVVKIQKVHEGYTGMEADLRIDDIIYQIDGKNVTTQNNMTGIDSTEIVLTIKRGTNTIIKRVKRTKVYF